MNYELIKILTYSLELALSNTYLEVIIKYIEPEITNEKAEVFILLLYLFE